MKVFVNGLQRTGTNYVRQILQMSTSLNVVDSLNNYHKHEMFNKKLIVDCDVVVSVIKSPYQWIESLLFKHIADIKIFYPKITDNPTNYGINLKNLCRLYENYYAGWEAYGNILIKYEDMLDKSNIDNFLINNFKPYYAHTIIPNFVDWTGTLTEERKNKYQLFKIEQLTKNDIDMINKYLSDDFFTKTKYKRIY